MAFNRLGETHAEVDETEVMFLGNNNPTRSNVLAKTGSYSWKMAGNPTYWGLGFTAVGGARAAYHFNTSSNPLADVHIFRFHETLTANWPHGLLWMEDELRLDLYVNGSIQDQIDIATAGIATPATWYHIAMTIDKVGGYASVYVDGNQVLNWTGSVSGGDIDFVTGMRANQTNPFIAINCYVDNFYADEISSESDAALPAYEFLPSFPDGASAANWTVSGAAANWQAVDDGAVHDGDSTYNKVSTSAGALEDRHETADIALPADYIIVAAHSFALAKKLDSTMDAQIEPSCHDGVSGAYGSALELPIDYQYMRNRFTTQPDASAWNETDFNAMRFGYRAAGSF
jgi:hypothetical protein